MHWQVAHLGSQAVLEVLIDLGAGNKVAGNLGETHEKGDDQTQAGHRPSKVSSRGKKSSVVTKNALPTASCP